MSCQSFVDLIGRLSVVYRILSDTLPLAFWLFLAGVRLAQAWQERSPVLALLMAQSGLVAYLLLTRRSDVAEVPAYRKAVAWTSALLPLGLQVGAPASWLSLLVVAAGLLLAAWSLWTLGKSFGIAPADRGLVRCGPYRLLRHPMYAGELLAVFGASWGCFTLWNLALWSVLFLSVILRIHWEEQAVGGYAGYSHQVRWRIIPGVW